MREQFRLTYFRVIWYWYIHLDSLSIYFKSFEPPLCFELFEFPIQILCSNQHVIYKMCLEKLFEIKVFDEIRNITKSYCREEILDSIVRQNEVSNCRRGSYNWKLAYLNKVVFLQLSKAPIHCRFIESPKIKKMEDKRILYFDRSRSLSL